MPYQHASEAIFRARTHSHNLYRRDDDFQRIKRGVNLPPGHDALLF